MRFKNPARKLLTAEGCSTEKPDLPHFQGGWQGWINGNTQKIGIF